VSERNENRPGYKKTKVGWIPEEWELGTFSVLANVIMGQSPDGRSYNKTEHGMPLINGPTEFTKRHPVKKQWTTKPTRVCQSGDILLCVRGSSTGRINIADDAYCIGRGIAAIRRKESRSCRFFIEHTLTAITKQILRFTAGSTFPNIDKKTLSRIASAIPPLPEQKKIAEILSTWEEAIDQTRKLLDAKKRRKKALMQQLLAGKKRVKGFERDEWFELPLGKLVTPLSRAVPKPNKPYLAIGLRSHGKGTFHRFVEEPEKVAMETLYRLEADDIVVNITFAWEGAIAIAKAQDSGGLVSHRFPTYRMKKSADLGFFRQLIISKKLVWDLGLISPGGAGRNRVMSQKDFLKLKVCVPSKKLQEKTGEILSAADNEIETLEKKLIALEKQKRGLMQKLLTGEVRVKVSARQKKKKNQPRTTRNTRTK